eukprot:scpid25341/ scgid10602/ 
MLRTAADELTRRERDALLCHGMDDTATDIIASKLQGKRRRGTLLVGASEDHSHHRQHTETESVCCKIQKRRSVRVLAKLFCCSYSSRGREAQCVPVLQKIPDINNNMQTRRCMLRRQIR